jgi:hypothetical protein
VKRIDQKEKVGEGFVRKYVVEEIGMLVSWVYVCRFYVYMIAYGGR